MSIGVRISFVPWMTALLVGACLAATDSAAVIGLLRNRSRKRLTTLLEGESLFNDGASVVAFGFGRTCRRSAALSDLDNGSALLRCHRHWLGVGGLIGVCVALLTQRYELGWVEQSLTLVTAYGTYLLRWAGQVGVVTAGLVIGNPVLNSEQNL